MKVEFRPTYLYIKQHTVTGKLYFGKTVKIDPTKYSGSGRYWQNHIKKHGKEFIETIWYCLFLDEDECTKFAVSFSNQENIVESTQWANQDVENGLGGRQKGCKGLQGKLNPNFGNNWSEEQRKNASIRRTGRNKGKTYEEMYGEKTAKHLREERRKQLLGRDHSGKRNPRALRMKATAPTGEVYIVEGGIDKFCKEHGLGRSRITPGKPHYLGWKFELLDKFTAA